MPIFKVILQSFSCLLLLSVVIPFIRKDFWIFRIFDYPRMQKFVLSGILITLWLIFFNDPDHWFDWALVIALVISMVYIFCLILPYTPLSRPMVKNMVARQQDILSLLVANVYQDNADYARILGQIEQRNPDIVFLVETDQKWLEAVKVLRKNYPYYVEIPQDNTYGLLFYSRLPVKKHEVYYLVDREIPSISVEVEFGSKIIRIFGLHPTPPVPQENMYSTERDAEILMVGKMVKEHKGPCLVIGDLNDVAWSYTTKLFLKSSGLLDPRRGRGVFSTYNANYPLLRWPLDHYFISSHFRLIGMKVEKHIGSDHFPISISLVISHEDESGKIEATPEDRELADEKIRAGLSGKPL